MKDKIYEVKDALCDSLRGLNQLTDMQNPSTQDIYNMSKSVHALVETYHELKEMYGHEEAPMHESWGNADKHARAVFEELETNYMGFWRCAAKYEETHSHEAKEKMLMYLEHQLHAHDKIAEFVMGNCPVLCDEVKEVIAKWQAGK